MQATDIDGVVRILDAIISDCRDRSDPLGYFPALYRQVTLRVRRGIVDGLFDDGSRMNRFDAAFANRYFAAYDAFRTSGQSPKCWKVAFENTRARHLIILQALVVGINAHINFDLGVAAGEMFEGDALQSFHADFDRINDILEAVLPQVEATVGRLSPVLGILAELGGTTATEALDFSTSIARDDAWLHSTLLSLQPPSLRPLTERALDGKAAFLGRVVARPFGPAAAAVKVIRETENDDVPTVIDALLTIP